MSYRIGHGYDVHRFCEDRPLMLGCIEVPFSKGLLGHSDADVAAHAIADALLGAAGKKDIGYWFPERDPGCENMSGKVLLLKVAELVSAAGFEIENIDATIVAQKPKLAPWIDAMREAVAEALSISAEQVNLKATTEEGLGITGTAEAMCAYAVCLLRKE